MRVGGLSAFARSGWLFVSMAVEAIELSWIVIKPGEIARVERHEHFSQSQSLPAARIIARQSSSVIKINAGNGKRDHAIKANVHVILNTAFTLVAHTKRPIKDVLDLLLDDGNKRKFTTLLCCERLFGSGNGLKVSAIVNYFNDGERGGSKNFFTSASIHNKFWSISCGR